MMPFLGICYAHQRGLTVKVLNAVAKSPMGVYGFFALPFVTLGMEKCIYDTVQVSQQELVHTRVCVQLYTCI